MGQVELLVKSILHSASTNQNKDKTMKEVEQKTEFVKEEEQDTQQFIFQKNTKTKIGTWIIVGFLVILIAGIVLSGLDFL